MITIEKLSKVYRTEDVQTTALNQVDLNIKKENFWLLWTFRVWQIYFT